MPETLLMATRGDEAEPVLVQVVEGAAVLVLDDGERLTFDVVELSSALTQSVGQLAA